MIFKGTQINGLKIIEKYLNKVNTNKLAHILKSKQYNNFENKKYENKFFQWRLNYKFTNLN